MRPLAFFALSFSLCLAGCLNFGDDIETTTPTPEQVSLCRKVMFLNPNLKIEPLGFRYQGSGIDDRINFKFRTDCSDIPQVFDTTKVDVLSFKQNTPYVNSEKHLKWWDVEGKDFLGGQISLPDAKFMNVGLLKTDNGYIVYISWSET